MRVLTVSELKAPRRHIPHQDYPRAGSVMDVIYRRLKDSPGRYVDLLDLAREHKGGKFGQAISRLQDDYGLDIRRPPHSHKGLYVLAGEWFGSHYSDYVAVAFAEGEKAIHPHQSSPSIREATTP